MKKKIRMEKFLLGKKFVRKRLVGKTLFVRKNFFGKKFLLEKYLSEKKLVGKTIFVIKNKLLIKQIWKNFYQKVVGVMSMT